MGHRLLFTFLFLFVGTSILVSVMQGGGGIVSTVLADDISANATFIPATSTSLFPSPDIIRIDNEKILYSSKNATGFIVHTRGYQDTPADAYEAGRRIYSTEAGVLNDAMGFNMGVTIETGGMWGLVMLPINFFTNTLPHLIVLNVNLFKQPALAIFGFFWFAAGIALLVTLAVAIAPIAIAMISGVFGLVRR